MNRTKRTVAVLASAAAFTLAFPAADTSATDTLLDLRILAAVLDVEATEGRPFPGPTEGLVPASWLRGHVDARHRAHLGSGRDRWGGEILYWSSGRSYLLLSLGADGRPQFDYGDIVPYARVPKASTAGDPAHDLLVVDGQVWRGPASDVELLQRSMEELRTIGTAMESYAVDNNAYPGPAGGVTPLDVLRAYLEPVYIRSLPLVDPWGRPYLRWSTPEWYTLIALGADGLPDHPYELWTLEQFQAFAPGATHEPGRDIVFASGDFVQWPAAAKP